MDTYFNLKRIGYLLQADWIEHRKSLLLCLGGVSLVWIAILYFAGPGDLATNHQRNFFYVGGLVTFIYYCRFAGKKIHQPKGLYYTLPASNQEKYFTLLLEGVLFFLAFTVVFWVWLFLFKLLAPAFSVITPSGLYDGVTPTVLLVFISSVILLSHITFRKHATLIGFTGMALYVLLFAGVALKIVPAVIDGSVADAAYLRKAFKFMMQLFTPVMLATSIVVLYIGYLKLKEKELR
ncbi:MAG: hypothetical protein LBF62_00690 [Tannerellaceae bacterium]|jgi:hypothetical protein|nr:hypothetical protein [Tannerellaceae bacterium]